MKPPPPANLVNNGYCSELIVRAPLHFGVSTIEALQDNGLSSIDFYKTIGNEVKCANQTAFRSIPTAGNIGASLEPSLANSASLKTPDIMPLWGPAAGVAHV
jgi:hypothetical protein